MNRREEEFPAWRKSPNLHPEPPSDFPPEDYERGRVKTCAACDRRIRRVVTGIGFFFWATVAGHGNCPKGGLHSP